MCVRNRILFFSEFVIPFDEVMFSIALCFSCSCPPVQENADTQEICVYIRSQLSSVLEEVVTIARNTKENENIRAKILASLESNEEEKRELETALRSLKKQSQRSVLELQVAVHQLKVEKLEMQQKVLEMQREAVEKVCIIFRSASIHYFSIFLLPPSYEKRRRHGWRNVIGLPSEECIYMCIFLTHIYEEVV